MGCLRKLLSSAEQTEGSDGEGRCADMLLECVYDLRLSEYYISDVREQCGAQNASGADNNLQHDPGHLIGMP